MFKLIYRTCVYVLAFLGVVYVGMYFYVNNIDQKIRTLDGGFFPEGCEAIAQQTLKSPDDHKGAYKKIITCPDSSTVTQVWLQPDLEGFKYILLFEGQHRATDSIELVWVDANDLIINYPSSISSKSTITEYKGISVYYQSM